MAQNAKTNRPSALTKDRRGARRAAAFASGATPTMWMGGRAWTQENGRAVASRRACRGRISAD